jgi:hypothetical protein
MELLDRYLQAVRKHLSWKRQDDIIAELRANLESQIEDKESEMGRTLTPAEIEAILKRMGPPMFVAGRYQDQQWLIGPAIYPIYIAVLQTAVLWAAAIYIVVSGVQIAMAERGSSIIVESIVRLPSILFVVAGWVTAAFAAFEIATSRGLINFPASACAPVDWNPNSLPPIDRDQAGRKPRGFAQAVAEVVFGFIALVWLLLVPSHPFLLFGPGIFYLRTLPYELAPVWMQFYFWIVGLNILQLGWRLFDLLQGKWAKPRPVQAILFKAVGFVPLCLLLTAPNHALFVLKSSAMDTAHSTATLAQVNLWVYRSFVLVTVIAALQLFGDIVKMCVEAYRKREVRR